MTATAPVFTPIATVPDGFHLVALVDVTDGEMTTDLDESKVSSSITAAVDRIPAGLRAGEVFAVWDFEKRPTPADAAAAARERRPARVLTHVGGGILIQLADAYRLDLEITG
ncbi:hypothetical protein [Streptomyces cucumeris]|uniref:hypothetical protein n=1 Tax=Streptomyces cucumeris TaxID=2962890 RepID=UPI0020C8B0AE|nr:hypothetical protein [Streptomyces sp. NEAU-Y11]MCP9209590.1 hypothetical protein [Streptomyces sp. NEAU-Y11]